MKKNLLLSAAIVFSLQVSAQPGTVAKKAASPSGLKVLTMEEAVYSRNALPEYFHCSWIDDSLLYTPNGGGAPCLMDPESGQCREYSDAGPEIKTGFPEHAENIVSNGNGWHAFTVDNDLYISDCSGNIVPVAEDDDPDIIYGQFVSRNEFGINSGIFWSPDGKKLAFYRKDNTLVGSFPLLDIGSRTGSLREIKYPMAGMSSENVRLGIYDLSSNATVYVDADDFGYDQYLTNVSWSPDGERIFVQVLSRSQKEMNLNMYDSESGKYVRTILSEKNLKYVEPLDPIRFLMGSDDTFIYRTNNRDGFRNLYLCGTDGNIRRLTQVDADVEYMANDGKYVYYTSAEVSPIENHLFRINCKNGKTERLTYEEGWHSVSLSEDCRWFVDRYSSLCNPGTVLLKSTDGKHSRTIFESKDPSEEYAFSEVSLGTVRSADGKYDNYYRLVKPKDFDPGKKYPVILYVYGGPHSQLVKNSWLGEIRMWEMLMAQKGYIVYVQDNRGTQNRGLEFEQCIHGNCGQAEMMDQMKGIEMLCSLPYVDKERIGVHGWSYGGFMTISLITNYPDVFKVAVAGGPVIDWKWYEVMYGERYMDNPAVNMEGYEKVSLINKAKDLKGKLLICQGAVDNVVVWEHSLSFIQECIDHNIQVDYFPYPVAEHNVMGKNRIHLMDKVTEYFEEHLR